MIANDINDTVTPSDRGFKSVSLSNAAHCVMDEVIAKLGDKTGLRATKSAAVTAGLMFLRDALESGDFASRYAAIREKYGHSN
jgi:hypothetical protein